MPVNIGIVTFNRLALTKICLESLFDVTAGDYVVTVVDNCSTDGTQEYLQAFVGHPRVTVVLLPRNTGVSVASNYAWALGNERGDGYYVKLDNDMEIKDKYWLQELRDIVDANPTVAMAGYRNNERNTVERITLPDGRTLLTAASYFGGSVLIPRRVHDLLGFWNEDYGIYGFEDVDYSNRATMAGLLAGYADREHESAIIHHGYDAQHVSAEHEQVKHEQIKSAARGEKLYLLNKLLFEKGIRPLYVKRKYLPKRSGDKITFFLNPEYRPLLKLQNDLMQSTSYSLKNGIAALDLRQFKIG